MYSHSLVSSLHLPNRRAGGKQQAADTSAAVIRAACPLLTTWYCGRFCFCALLLDCLALVFPSFPSVYGSTVAEERKRWRGAARRPFHHLFIILYLVGDTGIHANMQDAKGYFSHTRQPVTSLRANPGCFPVSRATLGARGSGRRPLAPPSSLNPAPAPALLPATPGSMAAWQAGQAVGRQSLTSRKSEAPSEKACHARPSSPLVDASAYRERRRAASRSRSDELEVAALPTRSSPRLDGRRQLICER